VTELFGLPPAQVMGFLGNIEQAEISGTGFSGKRRQNSPETLPRATLG
jgi:hypothetical protein